MCHILDAQEAFKILIWNNQLVTKKAKTRVQVFVDIQKFALQAHCVHGIPLGSVAQNVILRAPSPLATPYFFGFQHLKIAQTEA